MFSIVMDILIVVLLAGTIFYAYSLSKQLRIFRQSRGEFESLLMQLTGQINAANDAIDHMQEAADTNGKVLNKLIRDGQLLSDELQIVNDASDSLANRLERAASSRRSPALSDVDSDDTETFVADVPERKPAEGSSSAGGFAIRDREVDVDDDERDISFMADEDEEEAGNFHSQAERELYTALKRKS